MFVISRTGFCSSKIVAVRSLVIYIQPFLVGINYGIRSRRSTLKIEIYSGKL